MPRLTTLHGQKARLLRRVRKKPLHSGLYRGLGCGSLQRSGIQARHLRFTASALSALSQFLRQV